MTFEDMKKIVVDTLNCEEEKVTMEASLTEDLEACIPQTAAHATPHRRPAGL